MYIVTDKYRKFSTLYALLNSSDWIRKLVMVVVVVVYTYSPIIQNDIESFLAHCNFVNK